MQPYEKVSKIFKILPFGRKKKMTVAQEKDNSRTLANFALNLEI